MSKIEFKVNQRVISYTFGPGVVAAISDTSKWDYPVHIRFGSRELNFTLDGRLYLDAVRPDILYVEQTPDVYCSILPI